MWRLSCHIECSSQASLLVSVEASQELDKHACQRPASGSTMCKGMCRLMQMEKCRSSGVGAHCQRERKVETARGVELDASVLAAGGITRPESSLLLVCPWKKSALEVHGYVCRPRRGVYISEVPKAFSTHLRERFE